MQEAIWEDLPQELWRTGYSNLGLMKLLLITGPPVLNLPGVSLAGDEWALCSKPEWQLSLLFDTLHFKAGQGHLLWSSSLGFLLVIHASFSFYELKNRVRNKWSKFSNHKYSKAKYDPSVPLSCSHTRTHTHPPPVSQSLPAGVGLLCKAAWMGRHHRRLSVLLISSPLWSFLGS